MPELTDEQKKYLQVTPGIFSYNTGACKKENILVKNIKFPIEFQNMGLFFILTGVKTKVFM